MTRDKMWTEQERATPILLEADVVVVGGSPAGVAAAVGATRTGASVVLIEKDGVLGGQAADHFTISLWQFLDREPQWVVAGITREIFLRATELGGCDYLWETVPAQVPPPAGGEKPFELMGNALHAHHRVEGVIPWRDSIVEPQSLRFALHQLCEEAGVTLLLDSTVAGAMMAEDRIVGVLIEFRGQRFGIAAKVVVDATGHGDVAERAGCSFDNYHHVEGTFFGTQAYLKVGGYSGCMSRMCCVNFEETLAYMRERPDQWQIESAGDLPADKVAQLVELGVHFCVMGFRELRWKAVQEDPAYMIVGRGGDLDTPKAYLDFHYQGDGLAVQRGRTRRPVNLLDPLAFSTYETDLRKQHWMGHRLYRNYIPGFGKSRLVSIPTHVPTAFSRRVAVEYTLVRDDLVEGRHFDDVVGRAIGHDWNLVAKYRGFEIPYRALLPKGVDGLLVTGKSAGDFIHTVATCACSGHAAGVAAGIAAGAGQTPRQLDVDALQKALLDQDAVL